MTTEVGKECFEISSTFNLFIFFFRFAYAMLLLNLQICLRLQEFFPSFNNFDEVYEFFLSVTS